MDNDPTQPVETAELPIPKPSYYERNREERRAYQREYYQRNKLELSRQRELEKVVDPDAYERRIKRAQAYYREHREELLKQRRERYYKERDARLAYLKAQAEKVNPEP